MPKREIFINVDIETDGPIPGPYSMIQLGAVAHFEDGTEIDRFKVNISPIPGANQHPDTMAWWAKQPVEAWTNTQIDQQLPMAAMWDFRRWVERVQTQGKYIALVAFPAGFDFTFIYWYLVRFTGESPFLHSAIDGKTAAWAALKRLGQSQSYRHSIKRNYPKEWFGTSPHTHDGLDDAVEQAEIFFNIKKVLEME